ncbi:MAG: HPr family phosphocarrier protein [SAR324 cluster bacterium]|nr:HPr family phosphocarrier protein [SAR324 cluster bacterium]
MERCETQIINRLGLHARAAAEVVKLAVTFESRIKIHRGGEVANAKTIMELLMLGATKGTSVAVEATGADEAEAAAALTALIDARFNELE